MALVCLINIGFVSHVSWSSIIELLANLKEDEKAGADAIELLERKCNIHNDIRRLLIQSDIDAENLLYKSKMELLSLIKKEAGYLLKKATVTSTRFTAAAMSIPLALYATGAVTILPMPCMLFGLLTCRFFAVVWKRFWFLKHHGFGVTPYPEWFCCYVNFRVRFSYLAQPITDSSHPDLNCFLEAINY